MVKRFNEEIQIGPSASATTIVLDPSYPRLLIKNASGEEIIDLGKYGNLYAGGGGHDGDLVLRNANGSVDQVHIGAGEANLIIRNSAGKTIVELGRQGNLKLGGSGADGDIGLWPSGADQSDWSKATIHLDADAGDIRLSGADCSERFRVAGGQVEPGTVLVAGTEDELMPSRAAYDRRVAGVVSGAGDLKPGIVLGGREDPDASAAVALAGKVFCRVNDSAGPLAVGDLLTTSDVEGQAMRAVDAGRSFGAVLGKALRRFDSGSGLIPVLIALQ